MKRQKWVEGAYIKVPLGDGTNSIGQLLVSPHVLFFTKTVTDDELNKIELDDLQRAFVICVYKDLVTKGSWEIVRKPAKTPSIVVPKYFKLDPVSKEYSIYQNEVEQPANREDCLGLERLAVWDGKHVVERLHDLRNGMPNKWVEALKA